MRADLLSGTGNRTTANCARAGHRALLVVLHYSHPFAFSYESNDELCESKGNKCVWTQWYTRHGSGTEGGLGVQEESLREELASHARSFLQMDRKADRSVSVLKERSKEDKRLTGRCKKQKGMV